MGGAGPRQSRVPLSGAGPRTFRDFAHGRGWDECVSTSPLSGVSPLVVFPPLNGVGARRGVDPESDRPRERYVIRVGRVSRLATFSVFVFPLPNLF